MVYFILPFSVGMLKRLPLNKRVSDIAARAGFNPAPTFYGDIFIGRIQNKPTLRNLSFHLGADTDENAPWLRAAVTENLEYQLELNKITGRRDEQAGAAGSDGKTKEEDGYSWTQTERELEVSIPLPIDATSQQIKVKFNPKKMELMYLTKSHVEILLFERVDVDGCTWTLESGITTKKLIITMEKLEEAFWPRIRD